MKRKNKILICGILPPPSFGPSTLYEILLESEFANIYDIEFLDMKFFTFKKLNKISFTKLLLFIKYVFLFVYKIIVKSPYYILYSISFNKKPFLKDLIFVFIGKLLGCRIIQFDFGQYLPEINNSNNYFIKKSLSWLLKNIDAFIVMGENTKNLYESIFPKNRIFVVPGCVRDTVRNSDNWLKKNNGKVTVLYFSLLSTSKGFWTALNSVQGVVIKNPNVRFIFAGPVDSQDTFDKSREYISEKKLDEYVEFTGYIGNEEQRISYFRNSDIFIFPTQRDVFGLVLLHAMTESLPVIATIEGNVPEIIEDGVNGYLIPKGNSEKLSEKILLLASDSDLRQSIGATNKSKYYLKYTPSQYSKNMITAFEEITKFNNN